MAPSQFQYSSLQTLDLIRTTSSNSSFFVDGDGEDEEEGKDGDNEQLARDNNNSNPNTYGGPDFDSLSGNEHQYISSFSYSNRHGRCSLINPTNYRLVTCLLDILSVLEGKFWTSNTTKGVTYSRTFPKRYSLLVLIAGSVAIVVVVMVIVGSIGNVVITRTVDVNLGKLYFGGRDSLFNGSSSAVDYIPPRKGTILNDDGLLKPKSVEIHGLIFYGRWSRISILDCYLKRNLRQNGGWLDKVVFVVRTNIAEDLEALYWLLNSTSSYVMKAPVRLGHDKMDFSGAWAGIKPDILYVKIDDDVIFMDDNTIPRLVHHKLTHPEHFLVSANVINNPALSWVHYHLGAILPFLPDPSPLPTDYFRDPNFDWKPSKLPLHPYYAVPPYIGFTSLRNNNPIPKPPLSGRYRMLPLDDRENPNILDLTPIASTTYDPFGSGWTDPLVAVQQHYSFLFHIENNTTSVYNMGIWDTHYDRLSINMVVIWGREILESMPIPRDDEQYFTQDVPKKLGKHVAVVGNALAGHFSFQPQVQGVEKSDVLDKYRLLADQICGKRKSWI